MSAADRARAALEALQQHEGIRSARWVWGKTRKLVDLQTPAGVPVLQGLALELAHPFLRFVADAFALADAVGELLEEHVELEDRAAAAEMEVHVLSRKLARLEEQLQRQDDADPAAAWARTRFAEARIAKSEAERLARTTLDRKVLS